MKGVIFETLCSLSWLLLMMIMMVMIYVDEFLHVIGDDFDDVCIYWKKLMLIVDVCCWTYALVESYVHAFINVESDVYIHIGDDEYFVFILATTKCFAFILATINDTDVSWGDGLGDDLYRMYIESCLGALHNLTGVILAYVHGEYLHWWIVYLGKFGEYVKMWKCTCVLLYSYASWILLLLSCLNHLKLIMSFTFIWLCLIVNCELTLSGRLVNSLPYSYEWVDGVQD